MQISLALDWTPNPIHTGFYVAQANGWYREAGLDVTFLSPEDDDFATLPADRVAQKEATFGICPSEFVIQSHYLGGEGSLVAVAALLQHSASAFATLQSSGIDRPAKLTDRTYALLGLPFEDTVLSQMVYQDEGHPVLTTKEAPRLQTWQQVLQGEADCTWIFKPIEGTEAEQQGLPLHLFDPHEYGVPYGYAPVLAVHADTIKENEQQVRAFLQATARGYHFAMQEPQQAVQHLLQQAAFKEKPDEALALKMQEAVNAYCLTKEGHWGTMQAECWMAFIEWLEEQKCLVISLNKPSHLRGTLQETVFTNRFIEPDSKTEV